MSLLQAHLICIALVIIDLVTRAWRFQWILRGMRFRVSFMEVLALNTVGDAASAVTPLRLGGEPARLAALTHAKVPLSAGIVAAVVEVLVMWPLVIAVAGWLALVYAPSWWRAARPLLESRLTGSWIWIAVALAVIALLWWGAVRFSARSGGAVQRGTRRAWAYYRRLPAWPLIASVPLTLVSLAARVAILPVLALTLANPPAMGPLIFASLILTYGQLALPTPSGAGLVEIGFLGGAAGDLGARYGSILFVWRFYTTILLVALGIGLGVMQYGADAISAIMRGRSHASDTDGVGDGRS
ncbi:MAG TPA: lysylphosphatidylglycerol synthase transmembrane domain-containing protein [Gemmatimonadaceae bacterium]|nr:lysylphosphatidylglycerol synthase transmembrane domain-containing protein [Gemmatimonadaceae bacterium]HEU6452626.1 lysylphosphatidylglycerol synthase transmembrane domain-containing protein [Gemmatimonadaceae bacterium]